MTQNNLISTTLWFDKQAEEAVNFYTGVFPGSSIGRKVYYGKEGFEIHGGKEGTLMTAELIIDGFTFIALNGGPVFEINPSISFFVTYEDEQLVDEVWHKLLDGGKALMPLDKYDWSRKYGWVQDKFGVSWQISFGKKADVGGQTICPLLMFSEQHCGNAEAAMHFYLSVFPGSEPVGVMRYEANMLPDKEGTVMHEQFKLSGQTMMAMDSAQDHGFVFNEGVSLVINCNTQEEIDHYWQRLTEGGDPAAQQCGWLRDKYGVSWQVTPVILDEMLQDKDKEKTERVTKAFMAMKKLDIPTLQKAYEGK